MDPILFNDLVQSLKEAKAIAHGEASASRRFYRGATNMKCPTCGAAELIRDTRDVPYTYKDKTIIIAAVTGDFCTSCGDAVFDLEESIRTGELMLQFNKRVNNESTD